MPSGQGLTDGTAISLGDNANITIGSDFAAGGPIVTPTAVVEGNRVRDPFNSGPNVIEFNSFGTLTIGRDGAVFSGANATNGEAINVHGYGNTIINYGLIRSANDAAAIWFEDNEVSSDPALRNVFDNYGVIERVGGGNVMGTQHPTGGGIIFRNQTGATVIGNLNFAGGDDTLEFFPHSIVQGDIDGGAGTNALILNGEADSEDELTGGVANFQTLTKEGEGRWELSGSLSATDFVSVSVNQGTLALTGNNTNFEGEVLVDTDGILEARAQSLPTNTDNLDNVQNNGLVRFTQPDDGTYIGQIVGTGAVEKTSAGVLTLSPAATAGNTYTGGTSINGGTVAVSADNALGASTGSLAFNTGTLRFDSSFDLATTRAVTLNAGGGTFDTNGNNTTVSQAISGNGSLTKTGAGVLQLQGTNTYLGGTYLNGGTVAVSNDAGLGEAAGGLTFDSGTLRFDSSFDLANARGITLNAGGGTFDTNGNTTTVSQAISGAGGLTKAGNGILNLDGTNSYAGATTVAGGALYVNGDQSGATGAVTVQSGATLGGEGTIGGDVSILGGATLAPGRAGAIPETLTINGDLGLSDGSILEYSFGQADIVGGAYNDHTIVNGDLVLDGTINVVATPGGTFDPGVYRVISYSGTMTNNTLEIGTIPATGYFVQTSVDKQVNLVNTSGLTLNFWDGDAGPKNNSTVNGGNGNWQNSSGNDNWTNVDGNPNAPFTDGAFAIFMGTAGTVTVDNSLGAVQVSGMQFASDGYLIENEAITLVGSPNSIIEVGDHTAEGAAFTATIDSQLIGNSRLVKTDLGTLVLNGVNTYTGGTSINGGTLQIAGDQNLGDAAGDISFDGGTLRTTADFAIDRATELQTHGGTIETVGATTLNYDSVITGEGSLTKIGTGTLVLSGANSYAGGTAINGGTLEIASTGNLGAASAPLGINGGTLHTTADIDMKRTTTLGASNAVIDTDAGTTLTQQGNIAGPGSLTKAGEGALVLTGTGTYLGGTTIAAGLLQLGNGGTSGSITGDVINNGVLAFNRSNLLTFDGAISGSGDVYQQGVGTTVLNSQNSYSGATFVEAGVLAAGGENYLSAASDYDVSNGATLALQDFGQTLNSLNNAGIVDFGHRAGTTLNIANDYISDNGTLLISTALGNDNSVTDRLVVTGDTSGEGILAVRNAGGNGAQTNEGIKIVDITGASNASFTLLGDYIFQGKPAVVGGAYAYQLYKNGKSIPTDGDWYLRSELLNPTEPDGPDEPLYQPGAPSYEAYPQALLGLNGVSTLQQRVGNRFWAGGGNRVISQGADAITPFAPPEEAGVHVEGNGVWGRIEGAHNHIESRFSTTGTDYNQNVFKMQAGLDGLLTENEKGTLIGGVFVQYVHGKTKTSSVYGDGEISTDGYGLGGTLTWYGNEGFYVDAQAQATWYDSDLSSTLAKRGLTDGNDGFGYALSIESGKRFAINPEWSVTPQGQLVYSSVDFDDFTDSFGAPVSLDKGDSLQGRLGLTLDHEMSWQNGNGMTNRSHVYGIANMYYEFLEGTKVDMTGVSFASEKNRLWGGIGLGGSYNWDDDKYSIYGEGIVNTSLNNFGDGYTLKGNVGFRVKW